MKKIWMGVSLLFVLMLAACGFDEEKAIDESKEQLEAFFKVYEDMEIISPMETKALKETVHDSFADFFTKDYLSRVDQEIESVDITERSEEHTSELQSRGHLVCRLLLEKKKTNKT